MHITTAISVLPEIFQLSDGVYERCPLSVERFQRLVEIQRFLLQADSPLWFEYTTPESGIEKFRFLLRFSTEPQHRGCSRSHEVRKSFFG